MRTRSRQFSISLVVSLMVLATIGLVAGAVHFVWVKATNVNSTLVAADLNAQIADSVKQELARTVNAARGTWGAIQTLMTEKVYASREEDKREFVFLSQIQSQPLMSAIAYGWNDNSFFAARKLGDATIEMTEVKQERDRAVRRADRYKVLAEGIEFFERTFEPTNLRIADAPWFAGALAGSAPKLLALRSPFGSEHRMLAYAGAIHVDRESDGVLAVLIDFARISRFLSTLNVGQGHGAAFIFAADLSLVASPDPGADEMTPPLGDVHFRTELARETLRRRLSVSQAEQQNAATTVVDQEGVRLLVTVTPLQILDWHAVTIIPESFFTAIFHDTKVHLSWIISLLAATMTIVSVRVAHHFLARPIQAIAKDIASVEKFEFEKVSARNSYLSEINVLSSVIARMSIALSAFRRYMPSDLVRQLIARGIEARPGGTVQPVTIMFADLQGFTALSERLGASIVEEVSRFFEIGSRAVAKENGTVDKFIGDAIMAFWNAPTEHPEHALSACRAAIAIRDHLATLNDTDPGAALKVRIGINTGVAVVGNIGSPDRLNYTTLGDAVNVASRLEVLNRTLGTTILIGEETRRQAGDSIAVRKIDTLLVPGRKAELTVFELLSLNETGGSEKVSMQM